MTDPIFYYLKDFKDNDIIGGFYAEELNRVIKDEESLWDIERVIRKRKDSQGRWQYFVKWKGFSDEHNSWVY